jgi:hypothetical protein
MKKTKFILAVIFVLIMDGCSGTLGTSETNIGPLTVTVQGDDVIVLNNSDYSVTITVLTTPLPTGAKIKFSAGGDGGYGTVTVFTINKNTVAGTDAVIKNLEGVKFITFTVYSPGPVNVSVANGEITIS